MTKEEIIKAASYAIMKGLDYEELKYSDTMYGKEEFTDEVWDYVTEAKEIGLIAFREKYKDYEMYSI